MVGRKASATKVSISFSPTPAVWSARPAAHTTSMALPSMVLPRRRTKEPGRNRHRALGVCLGKPHPSSAWQRSRIPNQALHFSPEVVCRERHIGSNVMGGPTRKVGDCELGATSKARVAFLRRLTLEPMYQSTLLECSGQRTVELARYYLKPEGRPEPAPRSKS